MATFNHTWIIPGSFVGDNMGGDWPTLSDCHFFNFIELAFSWRPQGTNKKSKSQPTDLGSIPLFPVLGIYPYPVFLRKKGTLPPKKTLEVEEKKSRQLEGDKFAEKSPKWSCWSTSMSVEGRWTMICMQSIVFKKCRKLFDGSTSHWWTHRGLQWGGVSQRCQPSKIVSHSFCKYIPSGSIFFWGCLSHRLLGVFCVFLPTFHKRKYVGVNLTAKCFLQKLENSYIIHRIFS